MSKLGFVRMPDSTPLVGEGFVQVEHFLVDRSSYLQNYLQEFVLTHGVAPRVAVLFVQELLDNRRCSPRAALHSQLSPQVPAQCGPAPEEHSTEIAVEPRNQ